MPQLNNNSNRTTTVSVRILLFLLRFFGCSLVLSLLLANNMVTNKHSYKVTNIITNTGD